MRSCVWGGTATPLRTWFAGRKTCVPFLRNQVLGAPGDWRMLPTSANGQPAAAAYTRDGNGRLQPYGICVLTVTSAGTRRVSSFGDASLIAVFGYRPDVLALVTLPGGRGLLASTTLAPASALCS
jgi:RNA polymerase sigma-70 factor, ECF subfamily